MGKFRRTISFPNLTGSNANNPPPAKSLHVRSVSLPCSRSNPLINQLRNQINDLRFNPTGPLNPVYSCLTRMKTLVDSLDHLLQLPHTLHSLSSSRTLVQKLLEDFLLFVDVYGIFQTSVLSLKHVLAEAQVSIRRSSNNKDVSSMLGYHIKAQKKIANEISKLISTVGSIITIDQVTSQIDDDDEEEVQRVICEVHSVMVSVSGGVFERVLASFGLGRKPCWAGLGLSKWVMRKQEGDGVEELLGLRKKGLGNHEEKRSQELKKRVLKRMQEMEDCLGEIERGSESVFRSLITTRVTLLNVLTHA